MTCQYNLERAKDESRKRPKSKLYDRALDKARYAKHQSKYKRNRMNKILALFGLTEMWKHNDLGSNDASDAPGIIASTTSPLASISLANKFEQSRTDTTAPTKPKSALNTSPKTPYGRVSVITTKDNIITETAADMIGQALVMLMLRWRRT